MRHDPVTIVEQSRIDWKGIGYLFSIAGVLLLGAKSIPKSDDPRWYWPALILGVVTSIVGFGLRYFSHLRQRREIQRVKAEAEHRRSAAGRRGKAGPAGPRRKAERG